MIPRILTVQVVLLFLHLHVFNGYANEAPSGNPSMKGFRTGPLQQPKAISPPHSFKHAYKAEDLSDDVNFLGVILSSFHLSPVGIRETHGNYETAAALSNIEQELSGGQYHSYRRLDSPTHSIDIGVVELPEKFTRIPLARVVEKDESGKITEIWEVFWNTSKRMAFLHSPLEEDAELTKLGDKFATLLYQFPSEQSLLKASEVLSDCFQYKTLSLIQNRLSVQIGTKKHFIAEVKEGIHDAAKKTNLIGSWSLGQYFIQTGEQERDKLNRTTFLQVLEFDPTISKFVRMKLWEVSLDI